MKNKAGYFRDVYLLAGHLRCTFAIKQPTLYARKKAQELAKDYSANYDMVSKHVCCAINKISVWREKPKTTGAIK